MKIGIIGAGWYGCHIALSLKSKGYDVALLEKNNDIFHGISGNFGIRLHKGPHYPRSTKTRETCRTSYDEFYKAYPELVVEHEYSIYALGVKDAHGSQPKVDKSKFIDVCNESKEAQELDLNSSGYDNLQVALSLEEPSIAIGERVRQYFKNKLKEAQVEVYCNYAVDSMNTQDNGVVVHGSDNQGLSFDKVINATSFQSFVPQRLVDQFPIDMEVVYQPCLGLVYKDKKPALKPISFIVMDGWFPCLMPCIDKSVFQHDYLLTHGSYTILGSYLNVDEAYHILSQIDEEYIQGYTKPMSEAAMCEFWPEFSERFEYHQWKGTVLAKIKTKSEFRSSVVFEFDQIIHIIPGKVSNVFDAELEVLALLNNQGCIAENEVRFVRHGILDLARQEIETKPNLGEANTCTLNTYEESKININSFSIPHTQPAAQLSY